MIEDSPHSSSEDNNNTALKLEGENVMPKMFFMLWQEPIIHKPCVLKEN